MKGLPGFEPGSVDSESTVLTNYTTGPDSIHALKKSVRRPGIEPGPRAWKARILTIELATYILYISMYGCMDVYMHHQGLEPWTFGT